MARELDQSQREEYLDRVRDILIGMMMGEVEARVLDIESLLRDHPTQAEVYYLLGLAAWRMNDSGRAIQWLNQAHEIDSQCREYADALAVIYSRSGKLHDGLYFAKLATVLEPHPDIQPLLPMDLSNYFVALSQAKPSRHYVDALVDYNRHRWQSVISECEKELRINREHALCYDLLGRACLHTGDFEKARDALNAAIHLAPDTAEHRIALGEALLHMGAFQESRAAFAVALELAPEELWVATRARFAADFHDDGPDGDAYRAELDAKIAECARLAREESADALSQDDDDGTPSPRHPGDRVTVALVSNALCEGEPARLLEPLLRHHDRNRLQFRLYQQSILEDGTNAHLKVLGESCRRVFDISDDIMSIIMGGDQVDVLVDSCGYTENARPLLTALHAAPVQVGWLSPPAGIGQPGIDVVFSDAATVEADRKCLAEGQRIVLLTNGLLAYVPFDLMPDPGEPPLAQGNGPSFGGIADPAYLGDACVALWSAVLEATPGSRLILGNVANLTQIARDSIFAKFDAAGLGGRLSFHESRYDSRRDPTYYQGIDVYLDASPVNGIHETAESLWMGVPVVTLKGPRRAGVMGASLLDNAGCGDWIAADKDGFVAIAQSLVKDANTLAAVRSGLRDKVQTSKLFDAKAFSAAFAVGIEKAMSGVSD